MADSPRLQELRRRIQQDPASLAFAPLAEELRRAGRVAEAIQTCRAGLSIHPEYFTARATLGRALMDRGDLDAARAELTAVLAAAPDHLPSLKGLAEIEARHGDRSAALATYRRAAARWPDDAEVSSALDTLERELAPGPTRAPGAAEGHDGAGAEAVRRLEQFLDRILSDRARRH